MKIFITGWQGFIGSHLRERLKEHELILLKNDLRDHKEVAHEILDADPEIIVHLAARTEVEQSFYEQITFSEVNYTGTVNLIETAKRLKNLKNFVFASTMEVYGWQPFSDLIKEGKNKGIIAFCQYLLALTAFDSNQGIILRAALFKHYLTTAFFQQHLSQVFCDQHFVSNIL